MPLQDEGSADADALFHLHSLLVDAVRHRRGSAAPEGPVTVAEIYQELVPYRHVRAALGLELNADYEHTLLRLLAGEEQLARLEPEAAREQLARELGSANPNVTLYRKFAACDVWLRQSPLAAAPSWLDEHLADEEPESLEPESLEPESLEPLRLLEEDEAPALSQPAGEAGLSGTRAGYTGRTFTVAEDVDDEPDDLEETLERVLGAQDAEEHGAAEREDEVAGIEAETASGDSRPGYCMFCDSALPRGRAVRYCPYCGADQEQRPCRACGEAVEPGWAYCIACGEPAEAASA